jgi:hypothetical protein
MDTGPTRRAILRLGGGALVTGLAGCSGPFRGSGPDRRTDTVTPAPLPTVDADAARVLPVGAVVGFGPLELVITDVVRSARAAVLGGEEVYTAGDDEFLAVETVLRNRSDRYLAVAVDRYEVAHETGIAESIVRFTELASSGSEGLAFAPGERRRVRLHYAIPPETVDARLHGAVRVRSLPDESVAAASLEVDLTARAAEPGTLDGPLSAPVHGVGDRVDASGLSVAVREIAVPVELSNWTPPSGFEHLAVNLAVENDAEPPAPRVVGLGRFGGISLADTEGAEFAEDRWFDGTLAGGAYYDDAPAIPPGETNEGTKVVAVPVDAAPLYLFWAPPVALWAVGTGVAINRFVWRLR